MPTGSLVSLEDTISRDGQLVKDNTMGGVITNLHLPRDWWIFGVESANSRVHFAIGCHPKQAALLTASLLKRLEELVRRPGAVAVARTFSVGHKD